MSALATNCCLVNLTKKTPAVEDAIPKLVDVVAFADVNTEERIDDRLVTAASLAIGDSLTTSFQHLPRE